MAFTPQEIQDQLNRLKVNVNRTYLTPQSYQNFMPHILGERPQDTSQTDAQNAAIQQVDKVNTQTSGIMAQNKQDQQQMIQAQRNAALQKRMLHNAQSRQPKLNPQYNNVNLPINMGSYNYKGTNNWAPKWGKDNTPTVSDLHGNIPVGAPLRTVSWRGESFTVNGAVAPIFLSFLDGLASLGYKPVTIGGYRRGSTIQSGPQGGKGIRDLHSYGLAIDIDPGRNPVGSNGHWQTALPPGVAALAARYGISWGGSWHTYKDPMHFSIPAMGLQ